MTIVQVDLVHKINDSMSRRMTTWVNKDPKLVKGAHITLKGSPTDWEVVKIYDVEHDYNEFDWHRKWDNNI